MHKDNLECCTNDCLQGRTCPARSSAYHVNFDRLGQPVHESPTPWHIADLLVIALFVLCLVGIASGAFSGGPAA